VIEYLLGIIIKKKMMCHCETHLKPYKWVSSL